MTRRNDILLDVKGMTIGHRDRALYSGADIRLREGDCVMLCGANGSGKSTISRAFQVLTQEADSDISLLEDYECLSQCWDRHFL